MGCCGSKSTYGIEPDTCQEVQQGLRKKYGCDILLMAIKDQNVPGKLCLAGNVDQALVDALKGCLQSDEKNKEVTVESDKYDMMWDITFRNTKLTTGHTAFSFEKAYFPRGQIIVKIFDTIASFGWGVAAAPNFGGVESRDDKGNVTSTVDWPVFIFYKETQPKYEPEHLLFAVKDSNIPGKLCAAGPVGGLEAKMTAALQAFASDVKSEKDSYDGDFDVVWRNTKITTGAQVTSFSKKYFPKGKTNVALLECAYQEGWRVVACPNFGGWGDSWPCYLLRKAKAESAPEILIAAIKDANIPGKFCISGKSADRVTDALCGALTKVPDNADVKSEKDSYDEDHDAVCRNVHITTGVQVFSFKSKYFPRGDSMRTVMDTFQAEGFQVAGCPNFGGMCDSWPTLILEKRGNVPKQLLMAVKDCNLPGKVDFVGGDIMSDPAIAASLMDVFQSLCGPATSQGLDDYDKTFELAYRNTQLTSGHATFTWSKPYWPHGYIVEMVLQVLLKKGFKADGGPNFGQDGESWPCIIFSKSEPVS
jgi:hypothetical protein